MVARPHRTGTERKIFDLYREALVESSIDKDFSVLYSGFWLDHVRIESRCKGCDGGSTKADRIEIRPFFYSRILYVIINLHPTVI